MREIKVMEKFNRKPIVRVETKVTGAGVYFGDNEFLSITIEGSNEVKLEKFADELIKRWQIVDNAKKLMVKFHEMNAYGESMAIQEALGLNKEEASKVLQEVKKNE